MRFPEAENYSMKSALKPSLENLDKAVARLEQAFDKKLQAAGRVKQEPQLDLNARNEREVNRKIAAKLDQTIERLEVLLNDE
jgi:2-methylisocitrate lyase-like PEP mutase family enzyme